MPMGLLTPTIEVASMASIQEYYLTTLITTHFHSDGLSFSLISRGGLGPGHLVGYWAQRTWAWLSQKLLGTKT